MGRKQKKKLQQRKAQAKQNASSHAKSKKNIQTSTHLSSNAEGFKFTTNNNQNPALQGICGLKNLGNTCFFNSVLQCLLQVPPLRNKYVNAHETMLKSEKPSKILEGPLSSSIRDLFVKVWTGHERIVNPSPLFKEIAKKATQFQSMMQQDAQELLRYLLDAASSEVMRVYKKILKLAEEKNDGHITPEYIMQRVDHDIYIDGELVETFVDRLFVGKFQSITKCLYCFTESTMLEPFMDLSLSIPENITPNDRTRHIAFPKQTVASQTIKQKEQASENSKDGRIIEQTEKELCQSKSNSQLSKAEATNENNEPELKCENDIVSDLAYNEDAEGKADNTLCLPERELEETSAPQITKAKNPNEEDFVGEKPVNSEQNELASEQALSISPQGMIHVDQRRSNPHVNLLTLEGCIYNFTNPEYLQGEEKFGCYECTKRAMIQKGEDLTALILRHGPGDTTKKIELANVPKVDLIKRDAVKQMLLHTLPKILTIHLKRFRRTGKKMVKDSRSVPFPENLNIEPYLSKTSEDRKYNYKLIGIVSHGGSLNSGHYVAFTFKKNGDNSGWYYCSDSHVSPVSLDTVLKCEPYLLFYENVKAGVFFLMRARNITQPPCYIRRGEKQDIPVLKDLHSKLLPVKYESYFFENLINNPMNTVLLGVNKILSDDDCINSTSNDENEEIISFSTYEIEEPNFLFKLLQFFTKREKYAYIMTFGVRQNFQRRGVGEYMLEETISSLKSSGVTQLDLHVEAANINAIKFYAKKGFKKVKLLENHYYFRKQHHHAYLMRLNLSEEEGEKLINDDENQIPVFAVLGIVLCIVFAMLFALL